MLEILATILIVLWLLGLVSSYTLGGFIHILFVIAIVVLLLRLIRGGGIGYNRESALLETLAILLILFWILGWASAVTFGGFIHILLVIALVAILIRLVRGQSPF